MENDKHDCANFHDTGFDSGSRNDDAADQSTSRNGKGHKLCGNCPGRNTAGSKAGNKRIPQ